MRRAALLVVIGVLAMRVGTGSALTAGSTADPKDMGTICLVPMPAPEDDPRSLGIPRDRIPAPDYTVQLDARPAVRVKVFEQRPVSSTKQWIREYPDGTLLSDVTVGTRHTIVVRNSGKRIESFHFRLEAGAPDQCLFLKEFYGTWNLWPRASTPWCKCPAPR